MKHDELTRSLPSPLRLFLAVLAVVFLAELASIGLVRMLVPERYSLLGDVADAAILIVLSAPLLWFFMVRPLRSAAVAEHMQAATVIAHALDGIITINSQGLVEAINPAAERIFGYTAAEVLGQQVTLLMPTRYHDAHRQGLERVVRGGEPHHLGQTVELVGRRKDGQEFPLELSLARWHAQRATFYTGIVREITERKRAEEALAESEKRYHSLFENLLDGFAYCKMLYEDNRPQDFIYLAVNSAFEKLTGLKNVVGRRVTEAIPGIRESHPELFETYGRVALTGRPERFELYFKPLESWLSISVYSVEKEHFVAVFDNITERKLAEEALDLRTRQLEAIRTVSAEITRELDLPTLLGLIHHRAAELVGMASGAVFLWDEAAQVLVPRAWHGIGDWFKELRLRLGQGVAGRVAERRVGMIVNDYRNWPHAIPPTLEHTGITAILAEPLLFRNRLLGVITINAEGTERSFTGSDRELLALFATQAAIAIENARLHEAAIRRAQQLATLADLTRGLTTELVPERVAHQILAASQVLLPDAVGRLWEQVGDTEALRLVASIGLRERESEPEPAFSLGKGLVALVAATRQPVTSPDVIADPRFIDQPWARIQGLVSGIIVPLIHGDRINGVLAIFTRTPHTFTAEEISLFSSFAAQAAIAIENARLYTATEARAAELEAFREIDQAITARLELSAVLEEVAAGAMRLLGTQHTQIFLWDEASQILRYGAAMGTEVERVRPLTYTRGQGITGVVAQTRQPTILDNYQAFPHALPGFPDVVATITVPILFEDRLLGVLHGHTTQPGKRFTPDDLRRFQMLAGQAAIAIEHARLYDATVRQFGELRALHDTGLAITSSLTLDEQLEVLVQRLSHAAKAQRVLVALLDPKDPARFHQCLAHDSTRADPWLRHLDLSSGRYPEIQEAVRTGRQMVIPDVPAEARLDAIRDHLKHLDLRSLIVVPLVVRERAIGAVSLGYMGQGRTFTDQEVNLLRSFAAQAAIAIEKARLYEEVQQHAAELEERVQERTRELEAANEQLQVASRHKSEFLANMSHELRTPLNSIIGFAELVGEQRVGPLNEKQARYLGHIHSSGQHLLRLISDILDLSKVEAGKFVLQPEALPVATTLEDILVIARGLANRKRQELSAEIEGNLPPLRADPVRFKQILFNLLSNAVKFTPESGRITVTARRLEGAAVLLSGGAAVGLKEPQHGNTAGPQHWLEIRVTDTGIGIKAEDLPRLFQEFVQLEAAATKRHEGTGLGLALTKRLVKMHGGRIWAESEGEGCGSTFTVILPFEGPGEPPDASGGGPSQ